MNRRGFLTSFNKNITRGKYDSSNIYLPYVTDISLIKICKECEKPCVDVCETSIIIIKNDIPVLDMSKNGCTFCKKCAIACDNMGVLDSSLEEKININVKIKTLDCLSWNQTMCFTCKDACKYQAISFFSMLRPTIDKYVCIGCGMCIGACPANAIEISEIFSNI